MDGKAETSSILWKRINSNVDSDLAEAVIPTNDYFPALWTICRLLSRQIKRFTSTQSLENLKPILLSHSSGRTIEKQSSEVRQALVSSAMWLLENWPDRFVSTCNEAKISRMDFGAADNCSPGWFDSVVREYFARNVNWITREDVADAIGQLEMKGLKVSKNALRRKLGVSESRAINEILDQRREGTIEELTRLCEHYRVLVSHTPSSRDQQRTLCRDFLILLLTAFSGDPIETICEMNQFSVDALISSTRNYSRRNLGGLALPLLCLQELDDQFRYGIRPEFRFRSSDQSDIWFLSRFGKKMDGHSVRARFSLIMKEVLDPKLWNSVEVFRGVATANVSA